MMLATASFDTPLKHWGTLVWSRSTRVMQRPITDVP